MPRVVGRDLLRPTAVDRKFRDTSLGLFDRSCVWQYAPAFCAIACVVVTQYVQDVKDGASLTRLQEGAMIMSIEPFALSILFGLVSMFMWGLYDFIAKVLLRNENDFKVLFLTQLAGLTIFGIYYTPFVDKMVLRPIWIAALAFAGILYAGGYWGLLRAFKIGELSIVSPITSGKAVIAPLLGVLLLAEKITTQVSLAIILVVIGIFFMTSQGQLRAEFSAARRIPLGTGYALIPMFTWGFMYVFLKILDQALDPLSVVLVMRVFAMLVLIIVAILNPVRELMHVKWKLGFMLIALGIMDVIAIACANLGVSIGYVSTVSPLLSAYPVVSVCLAIGLLRERPRRPQAAGIIAVLVGILLLSVSA